MVTHSWTIGMWSTWTVHEDHLEATSDLKSSNNSNFGHVLLCQCDTSSIKITLIASELPFAIPGAGYHLESFIA